MPLRKTLAYGAFDEYQAQILTDAFEAALHTTDIDDRTCQRAEALASRIIVIFEKGARDPKRIARRATETEF